MEHLLLAAAVLTLPLPTMAQDHSGHQMPAAQTATQTGDQPASSQAFAAANSQMHADMNIPLTGDADVDFIAGMIPHHQGAVDTAKIVLQYGQDPEVRKFAEGVVAAQEAEITWMKTWLADHQK